MHSRMSNRSSRHFGHIPGIYEGQHFANRLELSLSLVHRPRQAGISGSKLEGADSIVISGGYEDDEDFDDVIIYTGHGGRDLKSGKQVAHQDLVRQNQALALNCQTGLPVRVIRGANADSPFAPREGYRYDGLYQVTDYWRTTGRSGFMVWKFRLEALDRVALKPYPLPESTTQAFHDSAPAADHPALRKAGWVQRIIRSTAAARSIKEQYEFRCQICRLQLPTNAGPYAEAAHIQPLGHPHNGPDRRENLLCLCPNHHVQFDFGGIALADDLTLLGMEGQLYIHPTHHIGISYVRYHRNIAGW